MAVSYEVFIVLSPWHTDGLFTARLEINELSPIFNGHFPGRPMVPGACMLQLVKDRLEYTTGHMLLLKIADHLKFMSMIMPGDDELLLEIKYQSVENNLINVNARLLVNTIPAFKFQGTFIKQ